MLRAKAWVSWRTLEARVSGTSWPVASMGEAAPTLVPGLMAATPAAAMTNMPADAAWAPRGVTKTATGSGDSRNDADHLASGLGKAARGVELDNQEGGVGFGGFVDGAGLRSGRRWGR